ncbi:MAG TPA: M28 family peptidase [Gemmatimonadaceae bacterium]|nr:M28 family peptidase [Gemmatimonadaceae bacterium]
MIHTNGTRGPVERGLKWATTVLVFAVTACATPGPIERALPASGSDHTTINSAELARDLGAFAHDSMRGRETGTPDANRAAFFIGERLAELGLEPVGDSLYYQRVPMVRQIVSPATRVLVTRNGVSRRIRVGVEVAPMLSLGEGQPDPRRTVDGEMIFAGYAITSKSAGRDDLSSVDLLNKVAVILHGAPPGVTGALRDSLNSDNELGLQLARIALKQPSAIVILMTPETSKLYRQLYPSLMRDVRGQWGSVSPALAGLEIPLLLFGEARRGSPFLPAGWPADDAPQALGSTLTASIDVRREPFTGYNVIGRVPGTDGALRSTYVAIGAHYDHIGVLPAVDGDSIANGADDDGSGSMAMLAMARVTMRQPARRSTLFIWHAAEEKGLLGSGWFASRPTVPLDSIVAMLNADMIGRNARDHLYVVGPHASPNRQSERLGAIVDSVNAAMAAPFTFDRSWDVLAHPEQVYQRSDHFSYAKRGVPVAFFTSGLHPQYHDVADEPGRVDYEKVRRVATLMLGVARAIGNDPDRPR